LHGELARAFAQTATPDPALVARHYHAAGEPLLALGYVVTAAKQAGHALALGRAAELYELALEHASAADKPELELELAGAYADAGRLGDAAEIYERALAGAASTEQQRDLIGKAMVLHLLFGNLERGAQLLGSLCKQLGLRPPPGSPWLAKLALALLYLRYKVGPRVASLPPPKQSRHTAISSQRLDLCLRAARGFLFWSFERGAYFGLHAMLLIRSRRDPRYWPLAIAWEVSGRCVFRGVSSERDEHEMAAALAWAEREGDPEVFALVLGTEGSRCVLVGQFARAIELFERAEQVLARRGRSVAPLFNWVRSGLFTAWIATGRMDQLLTRADSWVTQAEALGDRRGVLIAQLIGSYRFLVLDQPQAMSEVVSIVLAADREGLSLHPAWLMEPALYLDQAEEALAMYEAASRGRSFASYSRFALDRVGAAHLWIRTYLAAALRNPRRRAAYLQMVERNAHNVRRERFATTPAILAHARAGLAMQRGDTERALSELEIAAVHFERGGHQLFVAAARERIGKILKGERGAQLVAEAHAAAAAVGVRNPERMFRAMLTGFPE
jgi:tetratricopeptide (TPR) repeat protein